MQTRMLGLARLVGCAASLGIIALWLVLLVLRPYGSQGITSGTYLLGVALMAVAGVGVFASLKNRPFWLLAVFAVSFVPVGLYMLGTPGLFRWIGVFDLALAVAAGLMLAGRRLQPARS